VIISKIEESKQFTEINLWKCPLNQK
jgi:hypothetical protein